MGELKKSTLFSRGILFPIKINLKVKKLSNGSWELQYVEYFQKEEELLRTALPTTKALAERIGFKIETKETKDHLIASYNFKGSLDQVANAIVSEFLSMSSIGNLTLRDLIILGGIARLSLRKSQK